MRHFHQVITPIYTFIPTDFTEDPGETTQSGGIMQYAWLDYDEGACILITNISNDKTRKWTDEDPALKELREEGWTISGPYPDEPSEVFYGYVLNRVVN